MDVKVYEEKEMWCSIRMELKIPPEEELLAPKEEPQEVLE